MNYYRFEILNYNNKWKGMFRGYTELSSDVRTSIQYEVLSTTFRDLLYAPFIGDYTKKQAHFYFTETGMNYFEEFINNYMSAYHISNIEIKCIVISNNKYNCVFEDDYQAILEDKEA